MVIIWNDSKNNMGSLETSKLSSWNERQRKSDIYVLLSIVPILNFYIALSVDLLYVSLDFLLLQSPITVPVVYWNTEVIQLFAFVLLFTKLSYAFSCPSSVSLEHEHQSCWNCSQTSFNAFFMEFSYLCLVHLWLHQIFMHRPCKLHPRWCV